MEILKVDKMFKKNYARDFPFSTFHVIFGNLVYDYICSTIGSFKIVKKILIAFGTRFLSKLDFPTYLCAFL